MPEKKKNRYWTLIVYPDSAPEKWRSILDDTHIAWIESPLHDKDTNPDGTIKKAHWHIMLIFDGPMSYKTPEKISKELNSPIPKSVGSARGMVRYMIHMDNPEKYQYNRADIAGHSGADVDKYFEMTETNTISTMMDMVRYIHEHRIDNFDEFLMICIEKSEDWFVVATQKNTIAINKQLDAIWHRNHSK